MTCFPENSYKYSNNVNSNIFKKYNFDVKPTKTFNY